jgi:RNA recognition motif-containing protein
VLSNPTVSDHALWTILSQFGELRALSTEFRRVYNAVFAVFFDVRCAERAKLTLQQTTHMFVMVAYAGTCDWIPGMENQGKFIAYNVGSVDDEKNEQELRETFSSFGELKDVRAPRGHEFHRFVEYFDTRSAEMAVIELQQTGYKGRAIQIEFAFRPSTAQVEPALPQQLSLSPESPQTMAQYMGAPMMPPQYMGWNPYGAPAMGAMGMPAQPQVQGYGYQPWPMNQYGHQMMQQGGYNMDYQRSPRTSMDYQRSPRTSENSRGRLSQSGHDSSKINPEEYIFNMEEAEANENDAQEQHDPHHHHGRTTLMIRNIPNKYNQSMMLDLLNRSYAGQYDFFYLPIDFKNKCNLGYAFVNFKCAKQTAMFYKEFHNQRWEEFNSRKVCEVTYARVQGKEAMVEHFKNSRFPCENEEYLPLVFDTDGNQTSAHTLGHTQPKHVAAPPAREETTHNEKKLETEK